MKLVYPKQWGLLALLFASQSFALQAQNATPSLDITPTEARLSSVEPGDVDAYQLEISGPNNYHYTTQVPATGDVAFSPERADGLPFTDGIYKMQLSPIYSLTTEHREALEALRNSGDLAAIDVYRQAHDLPVNSDVYLINFSVRNGAFVSTSKSEAKIPTPGVAKHQPDMTLPDHLFASINYFEVDYTKPLTMDNSLVEEDQVFIDDLIVDGSICVGQDCVNGENFGFDTQRLKENNLRIHFNDTSASASFPSNDWRITINDSSNGGANYFGIEDATAGRIPFRVEAGAPANTLYVSDSGDVGFGTATPIVRAHLADGDSPTLRLEQNGSNGWTPQIWDVAGNETNFFIRDATNGSKLPFRIRPNAPQNSFYIDTDGDIGLGTASPAHALQVESGNVYVKNGRLGINVEPTSALQVAGDLNVTGTTLLTGDYTQFMSTGASFINSGSPLFTTVLRIDATNERIGIGTAAPMHQLEVSSDDVVKPTAGGWLGASDRRLKRDIADFNDGLDVLMGIRPVTYSYNGKLGLPTHEEHIGIIAQEIQEVAPYTIKPLKIGGTEEDYLAFDGSPLTYVLINAVQEQQTIIEEQQKEIAELKASLSEIETLKAQMAALTRLVGEQQQSASSNESAVQPTDK